MSSSLGLWTPELFASSCNSWLSSLFATTEINLGGCFDWLWRPYAFRKLLLISFFSSTLEYVLPVFLFIISSIFCLCFSLFFYLIIHIFNPFFFFFKLSSFIGRLPSISHIFNSTTTLGMMLLEFIFWHQSKAPFTIYFFVMALGGPSQAALPFR